MGCGQTNIRYWLRKFGLKTKTKRKSSLGDGRQAKLYSTGWDFIQSEYNAGLTYRGIAKKYGVDQATLNKARKLGYIKTRSIAEASDLWMKKSTAEEKLKRFSHRGNSSGKKGGYRSGAGRSKKFRVCDSFGRMVCLQSSYEKDVAVILNELNIRWVRPEYLKYDNKKYFPDFYLVDKDIYLDPKNDFLAKKDAEKISKVCEQNGVSVVIVTKDNISKEFLSSLF
jgi:hypothetical protein